VNTFVRLLTVICACAVAQAFAGGPASDSGPQQPASQSSPPPAADAATPSATPAPSASQATSSAASQSGPSPSAGSVANAAASTPAKSSPTPSPNPTSAAATSAADQPTKVVLVDKTLTNSQVKQLLSRGYKPEARGDNVFYCRREQQLGSRFETRVCRSAEQIAEAERASQEATKYIQRTGGNPSGK
jgi:hypothetical protein